MAKRKTQIDKAIEQIRSEIKGLLIEADAARREFEARIAAKHDAIDTLERQQRIKVQRKPKATVKDLAEAMEPLVGSNR